jgi:hypothetical protein
MGLIKLFNDRKWGLNDFFALGKWFGKFDFMD